MNDHMVHIKKMTPTFGMLFQNAFATQLTPQIEGFFRESKFSSKERWVRTHIGFCKKNGAASLTDLPGLHLCLLSCNCNRKAEQQRKGFLKRTSFLKMRTKGGSNYKLCTTVV